jgi:hypothetical protein
VLVEVVTCVVVAMEIFKVVVTVLVKVVEITGYSVVLVGFAVRVCVTVE